MGKWFGSSGIRGSYDVISPEKLEYPLMKLDFWISPVVRMSEAIKTGFCVLKTLPTAKPSFNANSGEITA